MKFYLHIQSASDSGVVLHLQFSMFRIFNYKPQKMYFLPIQQFAFCSILVWWIICSRQCLARPPRSSFDGERASYKTTYVWRTARRTEKMSRGMRDVRVFFGDKTTSNYTTNALHDEQSSYVFDAHSTHFAASNRKRNARRKTYEALWRTVK